MNPRCKIPCDMNSSSTKMLQIPGKMRGSNSKMLQNAVEMAVSSSNAANSKGNGQERRYKKRTQNRKKQSQNNFGPRHEPWWAMNHALVWLHPITQLRFACDAMPGLQGPLTATWEVPNKLFGCITSVVNLDNSETRFPIRPLVQTCNYSVNLSHVTVLFRVKDFTLEGTALFLTNILFSSVPTVTETFTTAVSS